MAKHRSANFVKRRNKRRKEIKKGKRKSMKLEENTEQISDQTSIVSDNSIDECLFQQSRVFGVSVEEVQKITMQEEYRLQDPLYNSFRKWQSLDKKIKEIKKKPNLRRK